MVKISVEYQGSLRCKATHAPSQSEIFTDAPVDNGGTGSLFSPTDLVATGLASCIGTILGLYAKKKGWDLTGMQIEVNKVMTTEGARRIKELPVDVWMPIAVPEEEKEKIQKTALKCPVHESLHPEIVSPITIHWK